RLSDRSESRFQYLGVGFSWQTKESDASVITAITFVTSLKDRDNNSSSPIQGHFSGIPGNLEDSCQPISAYSTNTFEHLGADFVDAASLTRLEALNSLGDL